MCMAAAARQCQLPCEGGWGKRQRLWRRGRHRLRRGQLAPSVGHRTRLRGCPATSGKPLFVRCSARIGYGCRPTHHSPWSYRGGTPSFSAGWSAKINSRVPLRQPGVRFQVGRHLSLFGASPSPGAFPRTPISPEKRLTSCCCCAGEYGGGPGLSAAADGLRGL